VAGVQSGVVDKRKMSVVIRIRQAGSHKKRGRMLKKNLDGTIDNAKSLTDRFVNISFFV
jgi:hypothetical protein